MYVRHAIQSVGEDGFFVHLVEKRPMTAYAMACQAEGKGQDPLVKSHHVEFAYDIVFNSEDMVGYADLIAHYEAQEGEMPPTADMLLAWMDGPEAFARA